VTTFALPRGFATLAAVAVAAAVALLTAGDPELAAPVAVAGAALAWMAHDLARIARRALEAERQIGRLELRLRTWERVAALFPLADAAEAYDQDTPSLTVMEGGAA